MEKTAITGIAPFFIVRDAPKALAFYRNSLGFDITFQGPSEDNIFFGIVQRGAAMIMMKDIGVEPIPNYTRDIKKGIARWDAYFNVPDPDALFAEFTSNNFSFVQPISNNDGLRGFEIMDADGYLLYFGCLLRTQSPYLLSAQAMPSGTPPTWKRVVISSVLRFITTI